MNTSSDPPRDTSDVELALQDAGEDVRDTLRRAAQLEGEAPGERAVLDFRPPAGPTLVRDGGAPVGSAAELGAGHARRFALAAGVLLVGAASFLFLRRDADAPVELPALQLGAEAHSVELVAPRGAGASFAAFDWAGAFAPDWTARVHVFDARGGELAVSEALASAPWIPDAAARDAWPARIRWELVLSGADGVERGRLRAEAERPTDAPR